MRDRECRIPDPPMRTRPCYYPSNVLTSTPEDAPVRRASKTHGHVSFGPFFAVVCSSASFGGGGASDAVCPDRGPYRPILARAASGKSLALAYPGGARYA